MSHLPSLCTGSPLCARDYCLDNATAHCDMLHYEGGDFTDQCGDTGACAILAGLDNNGVNDCAGRSDEQADTEDRVEEQKDKITAAHVQVDTCWAGGG